MAHNARHQMMFPSPPANGLEATAVPTATGTIAAGRVFGRAPANQRAVPFGTPGRFTTGPDAQYRPDVVVLAARIY